jgi:anti-sigma-K factor RskA
MTHRELLEHALLDALSLLDEDEREAFDRAFASAPPHVQAQVRREQTRLVKMESLLPDVAPPASLRARVLEAVRGAIASESAMAERGPFRLDDPDTIARLPAVAHRRRVAALWRAVALACTAAAIVLGVWSVHLGGVINELNRKQDPLLNEITAAFGPHLIDALVSDSTQRITLTSQSTTEDDHAQAAIWYNPDWSTAKLFGINLPAVKDNAYKLVVVDSEGTPVATVAEFTFTGGRGLLNREFPVTVGLSGSRLAVLGERENGESPIVLGVPELVQSH